MKSAIKEGVRRFALVLFVATMSISTSGLIDIVVPEPCSIEESTAQDDGACAATCVRCNCCARSIEVVTPRLASVQIPLAAEAITSVSFVSAGSPSEILHVPKL